MALPVNCCSAAVARSIAPLVYRSYFTVQIISAWKCCKFRVVLDRIAFAQWFRTFSTIMRCCTRASHLIYRLSNIHLCFNILCSFFLSLSLSHTPGLLSKWKYLNIALWFVAGIRSMLNGHHSRPHLSFAIPHFIWKRGGNVLVPLVHLLLLPVPLVIFHII